MQKQLTQQELDQFVSIFPKKIAAYKAAIVSRDASASSDVWAIIKIIEDIIKFWTFLSDSETQFMELMGGQQPPISAEGEEEVGLVLYQLNQMQNYQDSGFPEYGLYIIYEILSLFGMPVPQITATDYANYINQIQNGPGVVAGDGTYISNIPYAQMDPGWAEGSQNYAKLLVGNMLEYLLGTDQFWQDVLDVLTIFGEIVTIAPFVTSSPAPVTTIPSSQSSLTVAVFGDWGSGTETAQLVAAAISSLKPDVSIHLGDVYYSGTFTEEQNNLLNLFPKATYNFTMNSNHEMYYGANGIYGTALANSLFSAQNGGTYFAIDYGNWVLLGLDSAYFDAQTLEPFNLDVYMIGAIYLDTPSGNPQIDFINSLDLEGKALIVFTHHNAMRIDGQEMNEKLVTQLNTALNGRYPDFWYYGHLHNGVVYNNYSMQSNYTSQFTTHPQIRCAGHGAMPFGQAYYLANKGTNIEGVSYFPNTLAGYPAGSQMVNMVRNGFALLTINSNQVTEAFYEVSLTEGEAPILMWAQTTPITFGQS